MIPNDYSQTAAIAPSVPVAKKISVLLTVALDYVKKSTSGFDLTTSLKSFKLPKINKKNILKIVVPVVLLLVVVVVIRQVYYANSSVQGANTTVSTDSKPLETMNLNREFKFPLRNDAGKEVGKLTYIIESAELRKQIIVKGSRASAVDGRLFLILNLKIVNDLDKGLQINSRDYLRISVNGKNKELFAPDIHNDPVEVQAISTKNTRVGLAINEDDTNIDLQVGEINGNKEHIKLTFNN